MIARITAVAAAAVLAVGAALTAAGPALAVGGGGGSGGGGNGGGGTSSGCNGPNCAVGIGQWVKYSGSGYVPGGGGSGHVTVEVQQPPCLWISKGNQITGSQFIVSQYAGITPAGNVFGVYQSVQTAKQFLREGAAAPAGTWYMLPVNPNASQAGQAACLKLPLFFFAPVGQTPPLPPIPPRILAELAFNAMHIPSAVVTTSPAATGYVNLGTFAWWTLPPTVDTTAALPDGQAATVVAKAERVTVSPGAGGVGTVGSACSLTGGSKYPVGHPPAFGAGQLPDCGVLWTQPSTGATIAVTVTWQVLFHPGRSAAFFGTAVPGVPAGGITTVGTSTQFPVQEIQSVNGA